MLVLGWHGGSKVAGESAPQDYGHHDSAAALFRDGRLVAAVEEERLTRLKHSNLFPARAIRYCLAQARAKISDLDAIVVAGSEDQCNYHARYAVLENSAVRCVSGRQRIASIFAQEFERDVTDRLYFCEHHIAHVCGSWYASNFADALAVCLDGDGDQLSGLVGSCREHTIDILRRLSFEQSLGHFYTSMIGVLGFRRFDEYKAMGLAPYGDPAVYREFFDQTYTLQPCGDFELTPHEVVLKLLEDAGLLRAARRRNEPFVQAHNDFAAGLQRTLERIVGHVIEHFRALTGARRLCLSGGVAQNCAMNGRILVSNAFEQVYVPPAAYDAGNAIGAALGFLHERRIPICRGTLQSPYLGPNVCDQDIPARLALWRPLIEIERCQDAPRTSARLIADGAVVAWVQGRSEFGPRALGNRSILADPRPAENKQRINALIKKREAFRPFAPSVLQERLHEFFAVPARVPALPYMVFAVPVLAEKRHILGAVTHIDGSARVQSVSQEDNPRYHALIAAFGELTGVPIVLNTSFNNHAEPVVDSVDDAVVCFLTTGLDFLIVDDWLVRKTRVLPGPELLDLVPSVGGSTKLVCRAGGAAGPRFTAESAVNRFFGHPTVALSALLFRLMLSDAGTLRQRCDVARVTSDSTLRELAAEAYDLWQLRALQLLPRPTH